MNTPSVQLSELSRRLGTASAAGRWRAWTLVAIAAAAGLAISARQRLLAERQTAAPPIATHSSSTSRSEPTADEEVLARMPVGGTRAVALQTLDLSLGATPTVQLVATEFSAQPGSADRLARTDISLSLRGPYADVKRVLSIWSARFNAVSVLSLRMQPQPSAPGVIEANVYAALWSRPGVAPQPASSSESR